MSEIISYCFRNREGEIMHSSNESFALLPASNMKVVSGYSAYRKLGRDFEFNTKFTVEGDIITVWGDPCPLLDDQKLEGVLHRANLKNKDIREVRFANEIFDAKVFADGWGAEDKGFCYQTKVVPYAFSEGCYATHKEGNEGKPLHDYAFSCVDDQYANFTNAIARILGREGKIGHSFSSDTPDTVSAYYSETLGNVLDHIETYSCNFSIEVLAKYLSHHISGGKGNWEDASRIITGFMSELGLNAEEIKITDASGLSRLNLLTTSFLSSLIHTIVRSGDVDFIHILPSPGKGTLKNRLPELAGLGFYAKTGSINHCSSLTGYIEGPGVSFSVIINNSLEDDEKMRGKIDETILSFLGKNGFMKQ